MALSTVHMLIERQLRAKGPIADLALDRMRLPDMGVEVFTMLESPIAILAMVPVLFFFVVLTRSSSTKLVITIVAFVLVCMRSTVIEMVPIAVLVEPAATANRHFGFVFGNIGNGVSSLVVCGLLSMRDCCAKNQCSRGAYIATRRIHTNSTNILTIEGGKLPIADFKDMLYNVNLLQLA